MIESSQYIGDLNLRTPFYEDSFEEDELGLATVLEVSKTKPDHYTSKVKCWALLNPLTPKPVEKRTVITEKGIEQLREIIDNRPDLGAVIKELKGKLK